MYLYTYIIAYLSIDVHVDVCVSCMPVYYEQADRDIVVQHHDVPITFPLKFNSNHNGDADFNQCSRSSFMF